MDSSIPVSARAELAPAEVTAVRSSRARRTRWMALGGGAFVLLLVVTALAAPLIAPHDPVRQSLRARLAAPTLTGADGKAHLLGTDHLGRDVLSRTIHGARVSLLVGFAAVVVGGIVGATLGLLAGFRGGWADSMIMTLADAQLAFPFILLAIGIIAVLGPSFPTQIVVIGLSGWVTYARVLRSQVMVLRSREFVDAIQALGGSVASVIDRHVLPNVLSAIVDIAQPERARTIALEDAERNRHGLRARQAVEVELEPRAVPLEREPLTAPGVVESAVECHVHGNDFCRDRGAHCRLPSWTSKTAIGIPGTDTR